MNRKNLLISGFADEIDPSLNRQLEALQKWASATLKCGA